VDVKLHCEKGNKDPTPIAQHLPFQAGDMPGVIIGVEVNMVLREEKKN
jgi:hypothetical protein